MFLQVDIGDFVTIGRNTVLEACLVGHGVRIGKNCIIGRGCLLRDYCVIEDDTILPAATVVPPFTVFGGCPGRTTAHLGDSTAATVEAAAVAAFHRMSIADEELKALQLYQKSAAAAGPGTAGPA